MKRRVLIRVQARGGKFLGPDIGYSLITIRDALSGELLAQDVALGSAGTLQGTPAPGASHDVVIAPDGYIWWLVPEPAPAAQFDQQIDLAVGGRFLDISACGLTNGLPNGHMTSVRTWVLPREDDRVEPIVLVMPGLMVDIISPPPTTRELTVQARVTMMCGCKILRQKEASTPHWPWQPEIFDVTAGVRDLDSGELVARNLPMKFAGNSVYTVTVPIPTGNNFFLIVKATQTRIEPNDGLAEAYVSLAS
jgi:hypothetical protein